MTSPATTKLSLHRKQKNITIWIAEDNTLFRNSMVALINDEKGMACTGEFASCEDLLGQLEKDRSPDVFILDIGLPGMSGIAGVKEIKARIPSAQIIMITVFDDDNHIFDALCAGASGYMLKASSEEVILQSIRDVANGGSPMNPSIARRVISAFAATRMPKERYNLSFREKEILDLIIKAYTNQQIAQQLSLSYHTVDTHLRKIYEKLHVHSRTEAVAKILNR